MSLGDLIVPAFLAFLTLGLGALVVPRLDRLEKEAVRRPEFEAFRADFSDFRNEMRAGFEGLRNEMRAGFEGLRTEMHAGFEGVRAEMRGEIGGVRGEIVGVRGEIRGPPHRDARGDRGRPRGDPGPAG